MNVTTDEDKIAFPYHVLVDLTANPKGIEGFPANLESHLDAIVTPEGKYIVTKFELGRRSNETQPIAAANGPITE